MNGLGHLGGGRRAAAGRFSARRGRISQTTIQTTSGRGALGRDDHANWTKSGRFGLLDEGLDDSSNQFQPLRRHLRPVALAAIVCWGVVAPATARAADPPTADQLIQNVQTALSDAGVAAIPTSPTPAAPATPAAPVPRAQPVVDANALVEHALSAVSRAVPRAVASVTPATAGSSGGSKTFDAVSPTRRTAKVRAHGHEKSARTHSGADMAAASASVSSSVAVANGTYSSARVVLGSGTITASASARMHRGHAKHARTASAAVVPQRPPPIPLPPRPDAASPAQGGGQGQVMPLVVGALAALFLALCFELLPRTLPPPAFRKPRRIALPPWRPG